MKKKGFVGWLNVVLILIMVVFTSACGNTNTNGKKQTTANNENGNKSGEKEVIKIGVLASLTGALETYGKQTVNGFKLGLDYATDGTMEVAGKKIEFIVEDTETKSDVAVQKATNLLDHGVDFVVGSSSSGDTLAVLPLMEEYKKIMVVEPAVADSITGKNWNKYVFRTGRNSSQDAIAGAAAIASKGVKIATLAPDYAFGRDGVAAFKKAATDLGAEIVAEEYAAGDAVDFTSNLQRIIESKPDYLFVIWAGANTPWKQIADMKIQGKYGIKLSTGAPDIAALKTMDAAVGMEGFSVYHYTLPDNKVNDWLVEEYKKRFDGEVPDLFSPGGMSAAIAVVEALKKTEGNTNSETLIKAMEGMSYETPKGTMTFRPEDHQALQTMYKIKLEKKEGFDYPVPVLIKKLTPEETAPPIQN